MRDERPFPPAALLGESAVDADPGPLPGLVWYRFAGVEAGLSWEVPPGFFAGMSHLTAEVLLDGDRLGVFAIVLQEGEGGRAFRFTLGFLNQCQARIRMPLSATDLDRRAFGREGAVLGMGAHGDRIDLARVDRVRFVVARDGGLPQRIALGGFRLTAAAPEPLARPLLPRGPLLDELGQSRLRSWPGRTADEAELVARLRSQRAAPAPAEQAERSPWGGWTERRFAATGRFRVERDGARWWLADPDGCAFWSAGLDCVRPSVEAVLDGLPGAFAWLPDADGPLREALGTDHCGQRQCNFLAANLLRAFGAGWREAWRDLIAGELRRLGFNTVANWSAWEEFRGRRTPYVRPLAGTFHGFPRVFRDFPDVFAPEWPAACAAFAAQLAGAADDPALIGYFMDNEPQWGFASETPAAGMLFNAPDCHSRRVLATRLRTRYGGDAALAAAWGLPAGLDEVAAGAWRHRLTPAAERDLEAFSAEMAELLFGGLTRACRAAAPGVLNLGVRYYTAPPAWAAPAMRHFDVFSMNCYRHQVDHGIARIAAMLDRPVLIGEWHFGALDAGLPASGIGHVRDQEERGAAYRSYLEDAAAQPWCVGAHWFTLYDNTAVGRFDGECYNIGFYDVCHRPYPIAEAARLSHQRMYRVAAGLEPPFPGPARNLPLLFV